MYNHISQVWIGTGYKKCHNQHGDIYNFIGNITKTEDKMSYITK